MLRSLPKKSPDTVRGQNSLLTHKVKESPSSVAVVRPAVCPPLTSLELRESPPQCPASPFYSFAPGRSRALPRSVHVPPPRSSNGVITLTRWGSGRAGKGGQEEWARWKQGNGARRSSHGKGSYASPPLKLRLLELESAKGRRSPARNSSSSAITVSSAGGSGEGLGSNNMHEQCCLRCRTRASCEESENEL